MEEREREREYKKRIQRMKTCNMSGERERKMRYNHWMLIRFPGNLAN